MHIELVQELSMRQRIFDTAGRTGRRALTQGADGWDLNAVALCCAFPWNDAEANKFAAPPAERQPRASDQAAA